MKKISENDIKTEAKQYSSKLTNDKKLFNKRIRVKQWANDDFIAGAQWMQRMLTN